MSGGGGMNCESGNFPLAIHNARDANPKHTSAATNPRIRRVCAPTFAINGFNIAFNRLTKTIYHALTYTELYETG